MATIVVKVEPDLLAPEPLPGAAMTPVEFTAADGTKEQRIHTVSHTLEAGVADRLRGLAFAERVSESAVIEFALRNLLAEKDDAALGNRLRTAGASLRRKALA